MKRSRLITTTGVALFLLWMMFVFGSYYGMQKPFDIERHGPALAHTVWNLVATLLLFGIGWAVGRRILAMARLSLGTSLERALFSTGIGLGATSLLVLALGLLGWLRPAVLLPLFGLGALYLLFEAIHAYREADRPSIGWPSPPWWLTAYLGIMTPLSLVVALAPPLGFDSLFYHLTLPRLALETGRLVATPGLPHFNYPGLTEMLQALAMGVAGDGAAATIHLGYGILAGAAVYAVAKRWFGQAAAWLSVAVWSSMPMLFILAGRAYNDLALITYQVLALGGVLCWMESRDRRWLVLSGTALGLSMSVKYTSAVGVVALGVIVLWTLVRSPGPSVATRLRSLAALVLPAVIPASPWYCKSLAITGNPFYPFVFGGLGWDAFRSNWYGQPGTGIGWDIGELILLPWKATIGLRDMNSYDGPIGPILLLLLPVGLAFMWLARREHSRAVAPIGAFVLLTGAAWTFGIVQSSTLAQLRLLLPCLTAASLLSGPLIEWMDRWSLPTLSPRRLATAGLLLALGFNVLSRAVEVANINPVPSLTGAESRQRFLQRNLGLHVVAMEELDGRLPAQSKTLFLWEPRSYFTHREVTPDPILDTWAHLVYLHGDHGDADAIAAALRGDGYTHILLYQTGMDFMRGDGSDPSFEADMAVWQEMAARHLAELEFAASPAYRLYELQGSDLDVE